MGWFKTERGVESGFGIISLLQGIASGRSRSWSSGKKDPFALPTLYFEEFVRLVSHGTVNECTYQTLREDLELTLGFKVLLSENT